MPPTYDMDLKLAELKINGFVTFEDLIPVEKIDRIREAFMPMLERLRARETEIYPKERGDMKTGLGRQQFINRYTLHVPWIQPFADPDIYENPVLLKFLEQYWETDAFEISCYHSNNPYPGSEFQPWHRDIQLLTPHIGLQTCPHFGVKFPLVDTDEENGSFEVMPGTQYLADPNMEKQYNDILLKGEFSSARRVNMKKGTLWVQDPRALHRGTPNNSDYARPELVICYSRQWFGMPRRIDMTQEEYDRLSERGRKLLVRHQIVS